MCPPKIILSMIEKSVANACNIIIILYCLYTDTFVLFMRHSIRKTTVPRMPCNHLSFCCNHQIQQNDNTIQSNPRTSNWKQANSTLRRHLAKNTHTHAHTHIHWTAENLGEGVCNPRKSKYFQQVFVRFKNLKGGFDDGKGGVYSAGIAKMYAHRHTQYEMKRK